MPTWAHIIIFGALPVGFALGWIGLAAYLSPFRGGEQQ